MIDFLEMLAGYSLALRFVTILAAVGGMAGIFIDYCFDGAPIGALTAGAVGALIGGALAHHLQKDLTT